MPKKKVSPLFYQYSKTRRICLAGAEVFQHFIVIIEDVGLRVGSGLLTRLAEVRDSSLRGLCLRSLRGLRFGRLFRCNRFIQPAEFVIDVHWVGDSLIENPLKRSPVVEHSFKDNRTTGVVHKEVGSDRHLVQDFTETSLLAVLDTLEEVGLAGFVTVEGGGHIVNPHLLLLFKFLPFLFSLCVLFGFLLCFFGSLGVMGFKSLLDFFLLIGNICKKSFLLFQPLLILIVYRNRKEVLNHQFSIRLCLFRYDCILVGIYLKSVLFSIV